jgi:hypothetical protein
MCLWQGNVPSVEFPTNSLPMTLFGNWAATLLAYIDWLTWSIPQHYIAIRSNMDKSVRCGAKTNYHIIVGEVKLECRSTNDVST